MPKVRNNEYGKPYIQLHKNALKYLKSFNKSEIKIEVSISDEKDFAISNVIIFK